MDRLERVARSICCEVIGSYNLGDLVSVDTTNEDGRQLWQSYTKEAQAAIDAIEQWQPIDTSPEDTEVLVYRPDGIQKTDIMMRVDDYWYWPDGESPTSNPTHWMPLPGPPK